MAHDDAPHQRLLRRVRVHVDDHVIARRPVGQLVRTRAGGAALEPGVAHVAVGLVRHDSLHVNHAADIGRQAVEHEAGGLRLRQLHLQRVVVERADHLLDVVRLETELRDDEARRLVQLHHALQAERGIIGGHRIAGVELGIGPKLEGEGQTIGTDGPTLRKVSFDFGRIIQVRADQPAVAVGVHLAVGELVRFRRVEADDIVDLLGHHRDTLRRGGVRAGQHRGRGNGGGRCGQQIPSGQHAMSPRTDMSGPLWVGTLPRLPRPR